MLFTDGLERLSNFKNNIQSTFLETMYQLHKITEYVELWNYFLQQSLTNFPVIMSFFLI